jgi:DNA polymerase (family 10)
LKETMSVHNTDIAEILNQLADLLDIEGANPFRVRAYRNAARTIGSLAQSAADMVRDGKELSELPGIGKDLAQKIEEILKTGTLSQLRELESQIPPQLSRLMKMPGLGPRRVHILHEELGITTFEELKMAAEKEKISALRGFGKKIEQMILEEIGQVKKGDRIKFNIAEEIANDVITHLKNLKHVKKIEVAGSYRRRKETVADLDLLVTCKNEAAVMDHFVHYENVERVLSKGKTRSSVQLGSGMQMDLRAVPEISYGAALHYFTGSKPHNIAVRLLGVKRGIKINEYGVFKGEKRIAGKEEEEVFRAVDIPFIEPELRENRGEIEAAQKGQLPILITIKDIHGDLHTHTKSTDGFNSLEEMVEAARSRGYEYLAVTDHSKRVAMAHGFDKKRLAQRIKEIERLNAKLSGFIVLKSIELDILKDGSLDLPDDILKELDLTVFSVHYNFNLPGKEQTERMIRAMDNPHCHILAHPTGRLINEREPYEVEMERLMTAARERGCFLELNGHPDRLDLSDIHAKMAKDMGIKVVLSTDAHRTSELGYMRFGIGQARRGWLERSDVLNTRSWKEIKQMLRQK